MGTKSSKAKSKSAGKPKSKAKSTAKPKKAAPKKKPAAKKPAAKKPSKKASEPAPIAPSADTDKWLDFVEDQGVVLASARGSLPNIAETVAGEPIVGSWWAHPKSKEIFDALSAIDDSDDVRTFKLVDGKVTFVHRRMWPALVRLVEDGVIARPRAATITQEHGESGEHHNVVTDFPDWVPADVLAAASALTTDDARLALGDVALAE